MSVPAEEEGYVHAGRGGVWFICHIQPVYTAWLFVVVWCRCCVLFYVCNYTTATALPVPFPALSGQFDLVTDCNLHLHDRSMAVKR